MTNGGFAFGLGVGTCNAKGDWLEVYFPQPVFSPTLALVTALDSCGYDSSYDSNCVLSRDQLTALQASLAAAGEHEQARLAEQFHVSHRPVVTVLIRDDKPPANVPEAYLKLHLLSHRLVKPHDTNLEGLFGALPNVAWTSEGAIDLEELPARQLAARLRGEVLEVSCVDEP